MPANDERAAEHRNQVTDDKVHREIEVRAFFKFCERGCAHGHAIEDWLAAEHEVRGAPEHSAAAAESHVGVATDSGHRGRNRSPRKQSAARQSPR